MQIAGVYRRILPFSLLAPFSLSFPPSNRLSAVSSPSSVSRTAAAQRYTRGDLGQWKSHISYSLVVSLPFFLIFALIAVDERRSSGRTGCLKSRVGFKGRCNPSA